MRMRGSRSHYDKVEVGFPPAWQRLHLRARKGSKVHKEWKRKGWEMTGEEEKTANPDTDEITEQRVSKPCTNRHLKMGLFTSGKSF